MTIHHPEQPVDRAPVKHRAAVELRALISTALADLCALMPRLETIAEHRGDAQRPASSFLTVEARLRMDDLARSERAERRAQPVRPAPGLAWLNRATTTAGTGEIPAPVSVAAVSVAAEAHHYLLDLAGRLTLRLRMAGVCSISEADVAGRDDLTVDELAQLVVNLLWHLVNPDRLRPIHRAVEDLVTRARLAVEGADTDVLPDPCPHCGRHTLVVHHRTGVTRCERDPDTGHLERCRCADTYCGCQRGRGRHEWHRAHKAHLTTSWHGLRRAQEAVARRDKEDRMLAAAIERVRALHQPGWHDDAGEWHDHLVIVDAADLPLDHVCRVGDSDACADHEHLVPACVSCGGPDNDGQSTSLLWPCPTVLALEPHEGDGDPS